MEWARSNKNRGFIAAWPQFGAPTGLFLAKMAVLIFSWISATVSGASRSCSASLRSESDCILSDAGFAWIADIVRAIALKQRLRFSLAAIHSELAQEAARRHLRDGRVRALPPSARLTKADIDAATHIVGMMGVELIQEALTAGAQIVVAGRSITRVYGGDGVMGALEPQAGRIGVMKCSFCGT